MDIKGQWNSASSMTRARNGLHTCFFDHMNHICQPDYRWKKDFSTISVQKKNYWNDTIFVNYRSTFKNLSLSEKSWHKTGTSPPSLCDHLCWKQWVRTCVQQLRWYLPPEPTSHSGHLDRLLDPDYGHNWTVLKVTMPRAYAMIETQRWSSLDIGTIGKRPG